MGKGLLCLHWVPGPQAVATPPWASAADPPSQAVSGGGAALCTRGQQQRCPALSLRARVPVGSHRLSAASQQSLGVHPDVAAKGGEVAVEEAAAPQLQERRQGSGGGGRGSVCGGVGGWVGGAGKGERGGRGGRVWVEFGFHGGGAARAGGSSRGACRLPAVRVRQGSWQRAGASGMGSHPSHHTCSQPPPPHLHHHRIHDHWLPMQHDAQVQPQAAVLWKAGAAAAAAGLRGARV